MVAGQQLWIDHHSKLSYMKIIFTLSLLCRRRGSSSTAAEEEVEVSGMLLCVHAQQVLVVQFMYRLL